MKRKNIELFLEGKKLALRFMETGVLKFCDCEKKVRCRTQAPVLALALKLSELCLYSIGLGYNIGMSHFGVSEATQKVMVSGLGYDLEPVSGLYILSDNGKAVLKGSKSVCPALPPFVFDCIKMPK